MHDEGLGLRNVLHSPVGGIARSLLVQDGQGLPLGVGRSPLLPECAGQAHAHVPDARSRGRACQLELPCLGRYCRRLMPKIPRSEPRQHRFVEAYRITNMVEDVAGIVRALGHERAGIVGHDWGGAVAYAFAMLHPEMTDRLCVLNSPHPALFSRELQLGNVEQLRKSWYMFFFQLPEAPERLLAADNFLVGRAGT
ncbi:MAG: alpha/beta hydrolase [Candidatus Rokubacteria bacterium]|nr:alpha/beta hydrolase [Candidatus Rokubacteria bacterium]